MKAWSMLIQIKTLQKNEFTKFHMAATWNQTQTNYHQMKESSHEKKDKSEDFTS